MTAWNGSQDHIRWLEADIGALRETISLTQSFLATMAMSSTDRLEAKQRIVMSEQKIRDLNSIIERYRQPDNDTISQPGSSSPLSDSPI